MGGLLRFFDDEGFECEALGWPADEEMTEGRKGGSRLISYIEEDYTLVGLIDFFRSP
jgi:hypothetical protein